VFALLSTGDGRGGHSSMDASGSLQLDEIVVIRIIGGSDFFCVIRGKYDTELELELENDAADMSTTTTDPADDNAV